MARKKPKPQPSVSVPPTCSCLLLCDDVVYQSHAFTTNICPRGHWSDAIAVPKLPSVLGGACRLFICGSRMSTPHNPVK